MTGAQTSATHLAELDGALLADQLRSRGAQVSEGEALVAQVEQSGQEHVAGHAAEGLDQQGRHGAECSRTARTTAASQGQSASRTRWTSLSSPPWTSTSTHGLSKPPPCDRMR